MLMSNRNKLAKLYYMPNGFRILLPGDHVLCAVSGEPIELADLRYWSVTRQEPYANAHISARAMIAG